MPTNPNTLPQTAREIAARISGHAYMAYAYSEGSYRLIASFLLRQGLNAVETEWVLDSKHMRWSSDMSGRASLPAFRDYFQKNEARIREDLAESDLLGYALYIGRQIGRTEGTVEGPEPDGTRYLGGGLHGSTTR